MSRNTFERLRDTNAVFEAIAPLSHNVLSGDHRLLTGFTSSDLLRVLGIRTLQGRWFDPDETGVLVLSYQAWQADFGGDPEILGRKIAFQSGAKEVVGVLPDSVRQHRVLRAAAWAPLSERPFASDEPVLGSFEVIGRMRAGFTDQLVDDELGRLTADLRRVFPDSAENLSFVHQSLIETIVGSRTRTMLWLLQGGVGLVLVICLVNVSSLLLVRAASRYRQLAIRRVLGATGRSLFGLQLFEALFLVLPGLGLGLGAAQLSLPPLLSLFPRMPRIETVQLSSPVIIVTFAGGLLVALVCTAVPHFGRGRQNLVEATRDLRPVARRSVLGWTQGGLVALQVAVAVVLVVGAGLMFRTLSNALSKELGFSRQGLFFVGLDLGDAFDLKGDMFSLLGRIEAIPGIGSVGFTSVPPLRGWSVAYPVRLPDQTEPGPYVGFEAVTSGYFAALRLTPVQGRLLAESDSSGSTPVAVVNEAFARRYFPDRSPVGAVVGLDVERIIVGIVPDIQNGAVTKAPAPGVLFPLAQSQSRGAAGSPYLVVRTSRALDLEGALSGVLSNASPGSKISSVETTDAAILDNMATALFVRNLLSSLATLALLLAAGGTFAVVAFRVQLRVPEFGIRRACGARAGDIFRLVIGHGLRLSVLGLAAGGALSLWATRILKAYLFQVDSVDPLSLVVAGALIAIAIVLASLLPARQAARIHPTEALRYE